MLFHINISIASIVPAAGCGVSCKLTGEIRKEKCTCRDVSMPEPICNTFFTKISNERIILKVFEPDKRIVYV